MTGTKKKEAVGFRIDPDVVKAFKAICILRGEKANEVVEGFMSQVVAEARQKGEIL